MLVKSRIEGGSQESKKVLSGGRNPYPAVGCRVGGLIVRNGRGSWEGGGFLLIKIVLSKPPLLVSARPLRFRIMHLGT